MKIVNRRRFLWLSVCSLVPASGSVLAAAMVQENDALARTLAYVSDTTRANQVDYPSHTTDQMCRICTSFMGNPKESSGPCRVYSGRIVNANGWCSAFNRRKDATTPAQ